MTLTSESSAAIAPTRSVLARVVRFTRARVHATGTIFIVLIVLLVWIAWKNPNFTEPQVFLNFVRRATPLLPPRR